MIDVINLHKSFLCGGQRVEALRGVSLKVPAGRCAFVVGPSGSGKSTLLYLLGAMDRPTSGSIQVAGQDLMAMTPAEQDAYRRTRVGFIFQAFNLIGNLTAVENVLVPFRPIGITPALKRRAAELLGDVGLGSRLNHRPHQLSGGEQQRVAIARALIKDPVLILGDEPTGELDSKTGDDIYHLLRRLQHERRTTLVVVTHDHRFIAPEDLVFEVEDGRLADSAGPERQISGIGSHHGIGVTAHVAA